MSRSLFALFLLASAFITGCAGHHRQAAPSSWRMIDEGDPNPFITDAPEHAGTIVKKQEER